MSAHDSLDTAREALLIRKNLLSEKMLNMIDVAIWSYDLFSLEITIASEALTRITGYPVEKFAKFKEWESLVHEEDIPHFLEWSLTIRQGVPDQCEYRIRHASGEARWIQARVMPVLNERGEVSRYDGVVIDISSRKAMEEELHRSEQRYKSLFEFHSDIICELDLDGNVIAINPTAERITGERLLGENANFSIDDVFGADNIQLLKGYFERVMQGSSQQFEMTSRHKNGDVFHWEMKKVPIRVNNQVEGAFVICKDVTSKKSIEKALADREEQYRLIADNMTDMMGVIDNRANILFASPSCAKVLGISESFPGTSVIDYIHPGDQDRLRNDMSEIIRQKSNRLMRYRIVHANGSYIHFEALGTPVFGDDGEVNRIVFVARDISEKAKIEKELVESQARYRHSEDRYRRLVELSPVGIAIFKEDEITYINPSGMKMVGAESCGMRRETDVVKEWVHPDYHDYVRERIAATLKNGYSPPGEYQILHRNGRVIDISMTAIYDPEAASIQLMFEDITLAKQSQRTLIESEFRHYRLQASLDRFSHDLFGVMKVSQLERRLLREVREVMKTNRVSLTEVEHNEDKLCEIIETTEGCYLKIGEIRGRSYLLCIHDKPATLQITSQRVWLQTIARYVGVLFDNFLMIEDLSRELEQIAIPQVAPTWLLRLLFNLTENERKRLSQDLHDAALQEQIIWYRKLDLLMADDSITEEIREQLGRISQGLLDVVYQIRLTCNELRPPLLKEEGLVSSLEALFDFTQLRTNYSILFEAAHYIHAISEDQLIGLYRVVQEMLANATKHSFATEVRIELSSQLDRVHLRYEDNGIGMDYRKVKDSYQSIGIYGMKERVRSMGGIIDFDSTMNNGLVISVSIPAQD
ncbi:PAS domain S-box protein [Cohnella herbarum]|uniref:histidine kinase n=1 Tax=Cohnella herbarum TaxID=2728023 RepID=A0A7Z2ZN60_9BACL|nr:PAS domain S-box protein [Cohnella herbarum]QJD85520.1 PAS domain S-box protein [Cohnella herbarum]